ncbi:DUF2335 domain-containing protein [Campylobacter pinnipediorum]|uniref:DUF2335 domain-containing protein n=1 Tax=Campylobacter pinnipediorum subsp. pinnipediorum TaxID=1660067 RepID=A0AAX0L9Q6_9BACT|nr:DUF2335 domain-containing protein [Campylobacter pinnipediorum]OPA77356.1 hypothetical protein BFG04_04480 [Campylobacter pinnipediorum subsp. pinnipediorum]
MPNKKIPKKQNNNLENTPKAFIDKAIQQNLNINFIPSELSDIIKQNPNYTERVLEYLEKEQTHRHNSDDRILTLEEKEQVLRAEEAPKIAKYNFRGQIFITLILFALIAVTAFAIQKGEVGIAIAGLISSIVAMTPAIIGNRPKQKDNSKKQQ